MEKKEAPKHTHTYGNWVPRVTLSKILICSCGGKYLKTRVNQKTCVQCTRLAAK